ncbi:MAG: MATE family efflux transporter [Coriobacteriia bacterium]|nr:MATE family efflux transporter [Coriobacteriia bacterium]
MLVAMFAMVGFNIVDTFYVGQLGTEELGAMGFMLAVIMAVNSVNVGIGMGTMAVVSRAIGQGDARLSRRLTTDAILLALLFALVIVSVGLTSITALFTLLGAEGAVLEHIHSYMTVWYLGLPLIVCPMVGNNGFRAAGDTKTPATIMISALTVNAVLDPLFIFGIGPFPARGLQGAAIATVISQGIALVVGFTLLRRRGLITFERFKLFDLFPSWRRILSIAVPAAVTQLIIPVSAGIVTVIVATFGVAAVAGFGVATRLEMFSVMVIMALGSALVPFVGQNWGAGDKARIGRAVRVAITIASAWGAMVWLLSMAVGETVAAAFNSDPTVIRTVTSYMAIVFPSYVALGIFTTVTNSLNALHRPMSSMVLSLLRMLVLYVPLAYAGSALLGLDGVWWAALSANVVSGVFAIGWFRHVFARMEAGVPVSSLPTEDHAEQSLPESASGLAPVRPPA